MPYKSKAQAKAMNAKCSRGEIKQSVCDEFNAATKHKKGGFKSLPARARKKK